MITARNYAAQCEAQLRTDPFPGVALSKVSQERAGYYADVIGKAQHFVLPDGGQVLTDDLRGLRGVEKRLPFDAITVEFFANRSPALKMLVLAAHITLDRDVDNDGSRISLHPFYSQGGNPWRPLPWMMRFTTDLYEPTKLNQNRLAYFPELIPHVHPDAVRGYVYSTFAVLSLIEALTCANVEPATHQAASPKNASRLAAGKLPIYETKFLTVRAGSPGSGGGGGGTHAGPREHLRRGHIRRLETKNVWVNSTVVNAGAAGRIDKIYRVHA